MHKEKIRPPVASLVSALRLAAPDLGPHSGCGAVSESTDPSNCDHLTSVSTPGSQLAAAPEHAAPDTGKDSGQPAAVCAISAAATFESQDGHSDESDDDEDALDVPLQKISRLEKSNKASASQTAGPAGPNHTHSLACADAASSNGGGARGSWQGRKGPHKGGATNHAGLVGRQAPRHVPQVPAAQT